MREADVAKEEGEAGTGIITIILLLLSTSPATVATAPTEARKRLTPS